MELATICAYRLPDETRIEETQWSSPPSSWAVRRNSSCLNKDGEWEYEPMPSSRDSDFYARCRWPSPEEAYAAWLNKAKST